MVIIFNNVCQLIAFFIKKIAYYNFLFGTGEKLFLNLRFAQLAFCGKIHEEPINI